MSSTEVVTVVDRDDAVRLDKRIRLMAVTVRENLNKIAALVEEAKAGQIHVALGFSSWTAYLADALGGQLELNTDTRRSVVELLAGEGMSNRAIAQAVGVSHPTVAADLAAVQVVSDLPPVSVEGTDPPSGDRLLDRGLLDRRLRQPAVTGLDGKTYTAERSRESRPPRQKSPTFARLMKKLTDLNLLAAECLEVAEGLEFRADANWSGVVYDASQQYDSASALAGGLAALADSIERAVAK